MANMGEKDRVAIQSVYTWKPPSQGKWKLNTDVAKLKENVWNLRLPWCSCDDSNAEG